MTHVHHDLGAYVLGSLDATDAERVKAHLAGCAECAAAQAELSGLPRLLDLAVVAGAGEADPLPPAIEERILDRFARERPAPERPRRRWRPRIVLGAGGALVGAAVAAAALLLVFGFHSGAEVERTPYRLALQPASGTPVSARATAGLRSVPNGTAVRLWVRNLTTRPGQVYEVLCSNKRWTASAGTFRTDAHGNAYVELTTAAKRGQYDLIRVVRRTAGATQSVDVLHARVQS